MTGYLTANDTPGQHTTSWYAVTAQDGPAYPALDGDARADVCIIGGGYAGLSAALHLAERGISVILLEANRVGWGASGRNGGQLGYGPRAEIEDYESALGKADAAKIWQIGAAANDLVRDLIERHSIDCDLRDGRLVAGAKPKHGTELQEHADYLRDAYGHDRIRPVAVDEMRTLLGTSRYHAGCLDMAEAHLHPLKLAHGLARAADKAGATIHENSRVLDIAPGVVSTPQGKVQAEQIIVACNGYLDHLSPRAQRRMLPINNFIGVTTPLPPDRAQQIIQGDFCVCDSLFVVNYFRKTPDNRLLWGGGESTGRRFPADLGSVVRQRMLMIYPDLADLDFDYVWGGTLAITATRMPLFQDLGQGILAIGGWSGSGVHMATMGGKIAADAIGGEIGDWDVLSRAPTPAFPGGDWFRMPALRLAMAWYSLRDRL